MWECLGYVNPKLRTGNRVVLDYRLRKVKKKSNIPKTLYAIFKTTKSTTVVIIVIFALFANRSYGIMFS